MAEMGANEKRSYVEDCWEWSVFWKPAPLPNPHEDEMLPWTMQVADAKYLDVHEFTGATEEECVSSAYEFTRKSQEEIRQVKKQIDWIQAASLVYRRHLEASPRNWRALGKESDLIALSILAARESTLADLQRGMKEEPQPKTTEERVHEILVGCGCTTEKFNEIMALIGELKRKGSAENL